ncbi:MAG: glycosyl hydrolase 115 family protein [Mangrovibacterium sp.]
MKNIFFFFIATAACFIGANDVFCHISPQFTTPDITITSDVSIFIDQSEDAPIHRAVRDLVRDLEKVIGKQPQIIYSLNHIPKDLPIIVITCKGNLTKSFRDSRITQFESHLITTCHVNKHKAVVLQGADMRGTIYAIYTFSEKFLEIPPLWIWASHEPQPKETIKIPRNTCLYFHSPYIKWRACFPCGTDLLGPWQQRNEENYDALYETMLRLKLNTLEGWLGLDWQKPYGADKRNINARNRGLKISFTHTASFGCSYLNWERYWTQIKKQDVPLLSVKNIDALKDFWCYHIETIRRENLDVIWQVSFRSSGDRAFWETFADSPQEDTARAKVIEYMLHKQIDLLKELTGSAQPLMKITLYNECSDFVSNGLLNLPNEPNLIWNFVAARRDHFPAADIRRMIIPDNQPIGYYMNFDFVSSGSHLTAAEGPWKMEKNFRYADDKAKQPLTFSVANAGNIREFVRELNAYAVMMWDFSSYNSDQFMLDYCRLYFGDKYADDIAALYKDFYYSYWNQKKSDLTGFDRQYIFHDLRYARAIEEICKKWDREYSENPLDDRGIDTGGRYFSLVPGDNNAKNQLEAIVRGTEQSMIKLQRVSTRADYIYKKLSPKAQSFFNDDLRLQAMFMLELNKTLNNLVHAYQANKDGSSDQADDYIENALESAANLRAIKSEAEHGKFEDWYAPDKSFKIRELYEKISNLKHVL